jgi:hypothetical protein
MKKGREEQRGPPKRSRKEHVMMFAFVLAIVGFVALTSLDLAAEAS